MTATAPTRTCKYCGEAPHVPADACLTAAQKAGLIFGQIMLWAIGLAVVIGLIMWAAA
jgi:hypothetical protein